MKPSTKRPHVVILGAGFGGLAAARALARAPVRITLVDRSNHHLFQPLLYQVATAGLSPADIAAPVRSILRHQRNVQVLMGEVTGVDRAGRRVLLSSDGGISHLDYDYLIVATGARHSYFGRDDWEPYAPGLKTIEDATEIRRRVLSAFEAAELATDPAEVRRWLTFVIVGAGPTGVELAGAIAELARRALAEDFRTIDPRSTRVVLVEAGPRVLGALPEAMGLKAEAELGRLGVEVLKNKRVTDVNERGVALGGEPLASGTVVWAAGVRASPAARWLEAPADRVGKVRVMADCSLPDHPEIFVIGDAAHFVYEGEQLPGVAPVAMQQGRYVARLVGARARGFESPGPFRYVDKGDLATVGRLYAVGSYKNATFSGIVGWFIWAVVHIYYLASLRNRLVVLLQWTWAYFTYQRGARLIVGHPPPSPGEAARAKAPATLASSPPPPALPAPAAPALVTNAPSAPAAAALVGPALATAPATSALDAMPPRERPAPDGLALDGAARPSTL
ncbi:MAG TPA: NAD(P)/FAD-dependent oxidoreductase [Polyangiaceae bacterium]|nr:NAD(P)/FAD-dependent oxidoreductase [Polyangiaceae bacterium]